MSDEKKRYFKKRADESGEREHPEKMSMIIEKLPHNWREITARIFRFFWVSVGFLLLAVQLLPLKSSVIAVPGRSKIGDNPLQMDIHLKYLESLLAMNQLIPAVQEAGYISAVQKKYGSSQIDKERLKSLSLRLRDKKEDFAHTVGEYGFWSGVVRSKPLYRDGLYMLSMYSYLLYNDAETKEYLERAIELDPRFDKAIDVLDHLK